VDLRLVISIKSAQKFRRL